MDDAKDKLIGFYAPIDLAQKIEEAAKKEDRTVSSWLRVNLRRIVDPEVAQTPQAA